MQYFFVDERIIRFDTGIIRGKSDLFELGKGRS